MTNRINDKVYKVIGKTLNHNPLIVDETGSNKMYGTGHGFKVLQTKPASEAVVGDYMYRISSGTRTFPQHSVIKIINMDTKSLYYAYNLSVMHSEVIIIAQAEKNKQEKEESYPYFLQGIHNNHPMVVRQDKDSYTYIHIKSEVLGKTFKGTYKALVPCDFTVEPEIYDIDWWQQRFEAGLPVYAIHISTNAKRCETVPPKLWGKNYTFSMTDTSLVQQAPISNLCNEISLGATSKCSLQYPIIKEHPMGHTIQLTTEQFEALQSGQPITIEPPKPTITKWEPIVGKYIIHTELDLQLRNQTFAPYKLLSLGFQTVTQADLAMNALHSYARQLAWLAENDDGWIADWNDYEQNKYFIQYSTEDMEFQKSKVYQENHIGTIFMSEDNATKLAQLMNDGVVEF